MRYAVVLNAGSGGSDRPPGESSAALRDAFAAAGIAAVVQEVPPDRLAATVRAALDGRPDALIVGGGDGTIRTAAQVLAGTSVPFGILPLGTLNHFAKDLGMPASSADAVTALAAPVIRSVDVGEVNGQVFINNCSLGAYAESVRRRDALRARRGYGKWWAMFRATLATLRRFRRLRCEITRPPEGRTELVRTPLLVVANNRYSGHVLDHSLRDRLDAGELWLYTVHAHRYLAVLRMILSALLRRLDDAAHLEAAPVHELTVACATADLPVALDGELVGLRSPFRFRIRPGALRVLAPSVSLLGKGD